MEENLCAKKKKYADFANKIRFWIDRGGRWDYTDAMNDMDRAGRRRADGRRGIHPNHVI